MSEIPLEVTAAAMRALMGAEHGMVDSVARAILAERERATQAERERWVKWMNDPVEPATPSTGEET